MIKLSNALLSLLAVAALTACHGMMDTTPEEQQASTMATTTPTISYPALSPIAPPKSNFEEPPPSENPRAVIWRPGYWAWNGSSYSWVSGEFMLRPDPTAVWFPEHWIHHTYGWAFVAGYWE